MSEIPANLKKEISSVLLTQTKGVTVRDFLKKYTGLTGTRIDARAYGFGSFNELFKSLTDIVSVSGQGIDTTLYPKVNPEDFSYVPPVAKKIQARNNMMSTVSESTPPSEEQLEEWEQGMVGNMKGLYAVCWRKDGAMKELSREEIDVIFSKCGNIEETSLTARFVFVRYKTKAEAIKALSLYWETLGLKIPLEKMDPKHVIKMSDRDKDYRPQKVNQRESKLIAERGSNDDSATINVYIGNIPEVISKDDLEDLFTSRGYSISGTRLISKDSKRFGFVEMNSPSEAQAAVHDLHKYDVGGRKLVVRVSYGTDGKAASSKEEANHFFRALVNKSKPTPSSASQGIAALNDSDDDEWDREEPGKTSRVAPDEIDNNSVTSSTSSTHHSVTSPPCFNEHNRVSNNTSGSEYVAVRRPPLLPNPPQRVMSPYRMAIVAPQMFMPRQPYMPRPGHQPMPRPGHPPLPRPPGHQPMPPQQFVQKGDGPRIMPIERRDDLNQARLILDGILSVKDLKEAKLCEKPKNIALVPPASPVGVFVRSPHRELDTGDIDTLFCEFSPINVSLKTDRRYASVLMPNMTMAEQVINNLNKITYNGSILLVSLNSRYLRAEGTMIVEAGATGRKVSLYNTEDKSILTHENSRKHNSLMVSPQDTCSDISEIDKNNYKIVENHKSADIDQGLDFNAVPQQMKAEAPAPELDIAIPTPVRPDTSTAASSPGAATIAAFSLPNHPLLRRDVFDRMLGECSPGISPVTGSTLRDEMDIIVSLVVGNDIFWGQLRMEGDLRKLCNLMGELPDESLQEPVDYTDLSQSKFICELAGEWYRVWLIQRLDKNRAEIYYVDYGNVEVREVTELRTVPDRLWQLYPIAVPFRVVEPANRNIQALENKQVNATIVKRSTRPESHIIDLILNSVIYD